MGDLSANVLGVESKYVRWYTCNCAVHTSLCDKHHLSGARIPDTVLRSYQTGAVL